MSAEVSATTGVMPELIGGGGGVFDVKVDDETLFSKFDDNRFPESGEISELLRSRMED